MEDSVMEARVRNNNQGAETIGKKGRAGKCELCHHKVKGGGNRHKEGRCSIRGVFGDHRGRKLSAKRQKIQTEKINRGAPVSGLNKGKRGSRPAKKKGV